MGTARLVPHDRSERQRGAGMSEGAPQGMVDWELATSTARRLVRPGPEVTRSEADAAVAQLRELAVAAADHVQRITRMTTPEAAPPARVVDRSGWVTANVAGLDNLLTPLVTKLTEQRTPGR